MQLVNGIEGTRGVITVSQKIPDMAGITPASTGVTVSEAGRQGLVQEGIFFFEHPLGLMVYCSEGRCLQR